MRRSDTATMQDRRSQSTIGIRHEFGEEISLSQQDLLQRSCVQN